MNTETPVLFEVGDSQLFGMVTHPEQPNGVGIMIIQGGDTVNVSLQRNRLAVRMARDLASRGYTCLRFDYHGLGESTGTIGELRLSTPFTEDAEAAAAVLRRHGAEHIVLAGACFSSRTALSTAPLLDDVSAVVMATPPIGSYERTEAVAERMTRDRSIAEYASLALRAKTIRSLADPTHRAFYFKLAKTKLHQISKRFTPGRAHDPFGWVSRQLLEPLDAMVDREVPVLIAYGADDPLLREFDRAKGGRLGAILDRAGDLVHVVRDLPGVIHGFPAVAGQEAFVDVAYDWIDRVTEPHRR